MEVTLADLHNDHLMQIQLALYKIEIASAHARADGVTVPPEPPLVAQARAMVGAPAPTPAAAGVPADDANPSGNALVATYIDGQLQMVDPATLQ